MTEVEAKAAFEASVVAVNVHDCGESLWLTGAVHCVMAAEGSLKLPCEARPGHAADHP